MMPLEQTLQFGHDLFGRPLLTLLPSAAARSFAIAGSVALLTPAVAASLPLVLSVLPPTARKAARWLQDLLLPLPPLAISLSLAALSPPSDLTLWAALLLGALPAQMRYVLARTQEILEKDYALQSRALGATPAQVLRTHLLPTLWTWGRTQFPHLWGSALVGEAALSFLGVGAPLGDDTLGTLLLQGKEYALEAPWILVSVTFTLLAALLAARWAIQLFLPDTQKPLLNFEE